MLETIRPADSVIHLSRSRCDPGKQDHTPSGRIVTQERLWPGIDGCLDCRRRRSPGTVQAPLHQAFLRMRVPWRHSHGLLLPPAMLGKQQDACFQPISDPQSLLWQTVIKKLEFRGRRVVVRVEPPNSFFCNGPGGKKKPGGWARNSPFFWKRGGTLLACTPKWRRQR